MTKLRNILIYAALLAGALIFAWPFLWMATTSIRLERELYSEKAHLWPESPAPHEVSPYVDTRYYRDVTGPRMEEAVGDIEGDLAGMNYAWPTDVDKGTLMQACAKGIYRQLRDSLPKEDWNEGADGLRKALAGQVTAGLVNVSVDQVRRALCVGELSIRWDDLREQKLAAGADVAKIWQVEGNARLVEGAGTTPCAEVDYDLGNGGAIELAHTFSTAFPVEHLKRIELSMRDDDSWNRLTLYVEMQGRLYKAERAHDLADDLWTLAFWQEPGADDQSTNKIHDWILLHPVDTGAQYESDPNKLRVRMELTRVSGAGAWWEKICRNYQMALNYVPFWRYVGTSLFIVILSLIGTLFSCSLVAYSFARLQWPGRNFCFALMLGTMMVPPQVTMIPYFLIIRTLGWYNTLYPLWIGNFFASAFSVFLLRQFLRGVPRDLEDAARIDGCGFWRIYWHIMLPLVRPTLAVIGIFTFMAAWNDFMGPLIYLSDERLYPLSLGLYALNVSTHGISTGAGSFGMMMAGSLLMTLPVIVTFFFAQRYFLKGVALTGMKG